MDYVIKATGTEYEIEILAIPFGSSAQKDADGEYFSRRTNLHLDKFPTPPLVYFHGYDDPKSQSDTPRYVGRTTGYEVRDDGVWFRGVLDKASEFAKRVWRAAQAATARASTGSIAHLVRKAADGEILEWPVAELSVFDTDNGRTPANRYAVVVPSLKAVYDAAGLTLPADIEPEPEAEPTSDPAGEQNGDAEPEPEQDSSIADGEFEMDENEVKAMVAESVAEALKADREARAAEEAAKAEREQEIAEAVEAAVKAEREKAAEERRLPLGEAPYQAKFANTSKYDNLDDADLSLLIDIVRSDPKAMTKSNPDDAMKALAVRAAESERDEHQVTRQAMKMAGMPLKANELNQSTLASFGDEWIGVAYSRQLWESIRMDSPVVGRLPTVEVPQGMESITIPIESTPPTFYKVAQASAQAANPGEVTNTVTTSKLGTGNVSLTVGKLGAATIFTGELVEDSLIPWVSELRSSMQREALEVLEHVIIDGDTETGATANINDIAGTPAGSEAFLLFNGFRKSPLVTTTANSRSGTTLAVEDYLETLKLMGLGGKNVLRRDGVAFIQDVWTGWKSMELSEVKTQDVFSAPTIENGMLTGIWGRDVITTANMHRANTDSTYGLKANTAGKLDLDTASNNTTGSILAVRFDQWRLGWKRRITIETEREAMADATVIVAMMRVGMVQRDTEASAITYNITL